MRTWLILLVISVPSLLRAGEAHYLDLSRTNLLVEELPFRISGVIDSTHRLDLGSIENGYRDQRVPIRLYGGIEHSLDSFVVNADWSENAPDFLLQVNLFEVEEFILGVQQYASIDLNVNFIQYDPLTENYIEFHRNCLKSLSQVIQYKT
ncbi:MAG: hypothetical protein HN542_01915 [Flavobacteriales bacterium]|nr:hypothetical protein [Flavobacteriales bacterium]NCG31233.1 hypothetical protein [Bacteroidota bacterium]MBT4706131.1 hypothetical protein [Flavobacteriales bacterium]MBT4930622.1 hypothetical protein [Flavobacteriales bacterium]MBT5133302.1 hypothetical protein [Flavobacteriales bacterium]